jgi:anti-sigma factor RsiW
MTAPAEPEDDDLLLNAYLDGELDALRAREFEERLATEPELAKAHARMTALRMEIRKDLADDLPSDALRRRIEAQAHARPRRQFGYWQALAASLIVGAIIGVASTLAVMQWQGTTGIGTQVVAAHIRAMMAPQPIDVASSDRHTVKPWFDGKLAFAPEVIDLAPSGFPLVGGRIDVVGLEPVPALVYRAGKHLISLVEIPEDRGGVTSTVRGHERGFETARWGDARATYWAVTDASPDEMTAFVAAFRSAAAGL